MKRLFKGEAYRHTGFGITKNDCRMANERNITFGNITIPTKFQETLLNEIKNIKVPKTTK
ncbi:MAG: hypothetical protein LBJ00_16840 [Planctomycetaceae bacterium]|nr:hypothetical protein [Planctomycetaceae bacterium]